MLSVVSPRQPNHWQCQALPNELFSEGSVGLARILVIDVRVFLGCWFGDAVVRLLPLLVLQGVFSVVDNFIVLGACMSSLCQPQLQKK